MTSEPTNADRARWAKDALAVFTAKTFGGRRPDSLHNDELECVISDLVCDLMHFARDRRIDTGGFLQRACGHFAAELLEESLPSSRSIIPLQRESVAGHSPAWVYVIVSGGVVQSVSADAAVQVLVEDHDTDDGQPNLAISAADDLESWELVALLNKLHVPHRITLISE
jgi:hypothetical protein